MDSEEDKEHPSTFIPRTKLQRNAKENDDGKKERGTQGSSRAVMMSSALRQDVASLVVRKGRQPQAER